MASLFSACQQRQGLGQEVVEGDEVRTAKDVALPAEEAIQRLSAGNARFVAGRPRRREDLAGVRAALADLGQNPMAAVIGCADSRCPLETLFDTQPGDIFVLRNAGNTCPHSEGSVVASVEFAVGALGTKLVLVLGHTKCGAMVGATKALLSGAAKGEAKASALDTYLRSLEPVAKRAKLEMPQGASTEEIAARAVRVNVFHTMQRLMEFSEALRSRVASGEVQVHGAIYDITSGQVEFLGEHPKLREIVSTPPEAARLVGA